VIPFLVRANQLGFPVVQTGPGAHPDFCSVGHRTDFVSTHIKWLGPEDKCWYPSRVEIKNDRNYIYSFWMP